MVEIQKFKGGKIYIMKSAFEQQGSEHFDRVKERVFEALIEIATKYPDQRLNRLSHVAVITEEWGEVVQAILKNRHEEAQAEIAQTIACLVRLSHEIERVMLGTAEREADLYQDPQ